MRAHSPGRAKLGSGGDGKQQGYQRPALGDATNEVERSWVSPMHIFKRKHERLNSARQP